jgi:HEAT repeat protein
VRRLEAAALEEDDFEVEEELQALVEALVCLASPDSPDREPLAAEAVELLSARLDGSVETVRLSIATVLGRIGRHEDSELVASLLKDPSAQVRRAAVEALSRLEPGAASEPLRLALADEAPLVRVAAASALGGSESLKVLDDLQRMLQDEDLRVCAAAVRAIGAHCSRMGDSAARADAVALIDRSLAADGMVAMAAIEALRSVGGNEAAKAAVQVLDRPEPELVQSGVSCIAQHGDVGVLRELISLVAHPSWGVRADVIQTLADRGVGQAVPPILRLLETEQDGFVRDTILRALKRLEA